MPNRVVRLRDKDDNSIYPIAGGLVDNSVSTAMLKDNAVTNAKLAADVAIYGEETEQPSTVAFVGADNIVNGAVTTAKIADGAVTSQKIDWTTIDDIDISSYLSISTSSIARAKITIFGKIGFVDLGFTPTNNLVDGHILAFPDDSGVKPLYTTELGFTVGNDSRRALIEYVNGHTYISIAGHTSSASQFCRVFGMLFLQ